MKTIKALEFSELSKELQLKYIEDNRDEIAEPMVDIFMEAFC